MTTTFRIIVATQIQENYGAHDWDGKGDCPQYWKFKGGREVDIAHLSIQEVMDLGPEGLQKLVDSKLDSIESFDHYWIEDIIDWALYELGEETPKEAMESSYERDMAEYYKGQAA